MEQLIGIAGLLALMAVMPRVRSVDRRVFWATSLSVVVAFRLAQAIYLYLGIPDASRSLIISGYQVHHIVPGALICVLAALALREPFVRRRPHLAAFVCGVGAGTVVDEVSFMLLTGATDKDYSGFAGIVGIPILLVLLFLYLESGNRDR